MESKYTKIYVDCTGDGFELAQTIPANSLDRKKGPSPDQVTAAVMKFLESR